MKIKQTIRNIVAGSLLVFSLVAIQVGITNTASAACGNVQTAIINCDQTGDGQSGEIKDTGIWGILMLVVNILLGGVAVLALGGLVYGAVLYTSAGGNAEQVKKAVGVFTNIVIGIVAFAGMWVLLNFLIPGGAFNDI